MQIDPDQIDLKYDMGKGLNEKEVIVTGSVTYVIPVTDTTADADTEQLPPITPPWPDIEVEYTLSSKDESVVVLQMDKNDGDWCVSADSNFGKILAEAAPAE